MGAKKQSRPVLCIEAMPIYHFCMNAIATHAHADMYVAAGAYSDEARAV